MFHAIEKSKVREQFAGLSKGRSWKQVYRQYEDFLTAGVFGRLIYLPPDLLWTLIRRCVFYPALLPEYSGRLEKFEFWPRWDVPVSAGLSFSYKEPDLLLQFTHIDVIIEAKLDDRGNPQSPQQWAEEAIAKTYQSNEIFFQDKPILIFAIGGLGDILNENQFSKKKQEFDKIIKDFNEEHNIIVDGGSWNLLLNELQKILQYLMDELKLQKSHGFSVSERMNLVHLMQDIVSVLRFHGIKNWKYLSSITDFISDYQINPQSINEMSKQGSYPPVLKYDIKSHFKWWEQKDLRSINNNSFIFFKRSPK